MRNVLILLAVLGLIAGCATQAPDVTSYYDQTTGSRTDLMNNELESPGKPRELVWLNASRIPKGNQHQFFLEVEYMALADVGYIDIPPGGSLTLSLDGQPMTFEGSGSVNMRKDFKQDKNQFVRERAIYPVTRKQLQKIAMAKQVKVRIKGKNGLIERDFTPANFERVRRFVTNYAL